VIFEVTVNGMRVDTVKAASAKWISVMHPLLPDSPESIFLVTPVNIL